MESASQAELIDHFLRRLTDACRRSNRPVESIRCVAISKGHSDAAVRTVVGAGFQDIGENRVQEALKKSETLKGLGIVWHLVGTLQTNKIRPAIKLFSMIQSIDRKDLALALQSECEKQNTRVDALVQVDPTAEPEKHGLRPEDTRAFLKELRSLGRLRIRGIMTIGPNTEDRTASRSCFRSVRELFTDARKEGIVSDEFDTLSMGMSSDFEIAIEEGSTMIRIGTLLFGPRPAARL